MELKETILIVCYVFLGLISTYCFLFQRTVRKIRLSAVGADGFKFEKYFYPEWYFGLYYLSKLRYITLIWLVIVNWHWALALAFIIWNLKMILPEGDYRNIQIVKRHLQEKSANGTSGSRYAEFLNWVLMAEIETLKPETGITKKKDKSRFVLLIFYVIIGLASYFAGGFIYHSMFK